MKRVVVTGIGIVSSLGNNCQEVLASLRALKSGITFDPVYRDMGLRSQVAGNIALDPKEHIDRKILRFMGPAAAYSYIALQEAIAQSGLTPEQVSNLRTGIVAGSGGAPSRPPGAPRPGVCPSPRRRPPTKSLLPRISSQTGQDTQSSLTVGSAISPPNASQERKVRPPRGTPTPQASMA